jgi:bacterioferritin
MAHAIAIGEKITALGGHPSLKVKPVPETNKHNVMDILEESLEFERDGLRLYHELLGMVGEDVALEEMVRGLILEETTHIEEVEKMIRNSK